VDVRDSRVDAGVDRAIQGGYADRVQRLLLGAAEFTRGCKSDSATAATREATAGARAEVGPLAVPLSEEKQRDSGGSFVVVSEWLPEMRRELAGRAPCGL